ncbi:MAG: GrlR family regulatory protein [Pseudomonadota bacterium]
MTNKEDSLNKFNGLWTVEFISTINRTGKGVLVLYNRRLLGGDSAYYYSGNYEINKNKISGNLIVIRYEPIGISVFGDIDSFKLSFSGEVNNLHFSAVANIPNMPQLKIRIVGNKKEDF